MTYLLGFLWGEGVDWVEKAISGYNISLKLPSLPVFVMIRFQPPVQTCEILQVQQAQSLLEPWLPLDYHEGHHTPEPEVETHQMFPFC